MIKKYRTIVVEDEEHDMSLFLNLLKKHPEIDVIDTVDDVENAIGSISIHKPDVVFLDIELYGRKSFKVLDIINKYKLNPVLIFTTAFAEYMKDAFKYSAFRYLLKPIDPEELKEAIENIEHNNTESSFNEKYERFNDARKNLLINTLEGFIVIKPEEIVYAAANDGYTDIYLDNGNKETVSKKLGEIEKQLSDETFFRCHRSYLINIHKFEKQNRRKCYLRVNNEIKEIDIAKDKISILKNRLMLFNPDYSYPKTDN